MDMASRARLQARMVLVVYRTEMARLGAIDISPTDRRAWEQILQRRSIQVLDEALFKLGPASDADARRSLDEARAEIGGPSAT